LGGTDETKDACNIDNVSLPSADHGGKELLGNEERGDGIDVERAVMSFKVELEAHL